MAKIKKKSKKEKITFESQQLPQNIMLVGENDKDKKIYIKQDVYNEIHKFTSNKTENEAGGLLIGTIIEEFSKQNIVIQGFVEAKYTEATPTTLTFTHETWDYCHKFIDDNYENAKIVGWIHTHPSFGIFLSEYDMFIQENFFRDENEIAYVVDPIQQDEGFFCWKNDKVVRTEGFFIYDEVGEQISADFLESEFQEEEESRDTDSSVELYNIKKKLKINTILTISLAILTILLAVACFFLSREISMITNSLCPLRSYGDEYVINGILTKNTSSDTSESQDSTSDGSSDATSSSDDKSSDTTSSSKDESSDASSSSSDSSGSTSDSSNNLTNN